MTPEDIIYRANQMIGVAEMMGKYQIHPSVQMEIAEMTAQELAETWPPYEGFGGSDGTYVVKDYLDSLINMLNLHYRTAWIPVRLGTRLGVECTL